MAQRNDSVPQFGERAEPEDHCYRHKDRPSFTLCQRCGRTVCPECRTESQVGVLCVECVRESAPSAATRVRRSAVVATKRVTNTDAPVVTYTIMVACVVVFAAQMLSFWFGGNEVTKFLWYAPLYSLPELFEPWRMVTAMFTHSTDVLLHILFNMYALWLFGPNLERMVGRLWFSLLYVFSGIGGSLAAMVWVYFAPNQIVALQTATVGASGAIFGVLMATLVAYRAHRVNVTSLAVLIGINVAIGFLPGASISWQAHIGGMLIGALVMWLLLRTRGPRKNNSRIWAMTALGLALAAASCLYFVALPLPIAG